MALVIAMAMVLTMMSVTAFAGDLEPGDTPAETSTKGSITIKPSSTVTLENKTLTAYKILDATYSGTGADQSVAYTVPTTMKAFYNSEFAGKIEGEDKTAEEMAAAAGKTFDQYVVEQIDAMKTDAGKLKDFEYRALAAAKAGGATAIAGVKEGNNVKFADLDAGYYVVEDEGAAKPISAVILDTVTNANVEIELKASDDTEKVVMTADELANQKANELGIGRNVEYKITQKIPDTTGYTYFYYMINDTLSTGLTFNPDSLKVKVGGTELEKGTDYYLYANETADAAVLNGKTFIVAFKDVVADIAAEKYAAGDAVEVTYTATVNDDAVTGVDPNTNTANVEYSNNPDKDEKGDVDENHPGIPKNDGNHPTGTGPNKITDTFTTKITIYKQDGTSEEKLEGVEFTLTGTSQDVVLNAEEVYEVDPTGAFWMLKDGSYTDQAPQEEPTVEETDGTEGWVEAEAGYEGTDTRTVGEKTYRPYNATDDGDVTHYVIVEANTDDYASTTIKYKKVVKTADAAEEYDVQRVGTTNANGELSFAQLGAGSYTLSETAGLPGYNGIADITFDVEVTLPDYKDEDDNLINFTGEEKAKWEVKNVSNGVIEYDQTNGTFKITIDNNKGQELPSTGGIGTTIFYVIGTILVLGAGVVLITRRRMDA